MWKCWLPQTQLLGRVASCTCPRGTSPGPLLCSSASLSTDAVDPAQASTATVEHKESTQQDTRKQRSPSHSGATDGSAYLRLMSPTNRISYAHVTQADVMRLLNGAPTSVSIDYGPQYWASAFYARFPDSSVLTHTLAALKASHGSLDYLSLGNRRITVSQVEQAAVLAGTRGPRNQVVRRLSNWYRTTQAAQEVLEGIEQGVKGSYAVAPLGRSSGCLLYLTTTRPVHQEVLQRELFEGYELAPPFCVAADAMYPPRQTADDGNAAHLAQGASAGFTQFLVSFTSKHEAAHAAMLHHNSLVGQNRVSMHVVP